MLRRPAPLLAMLVLAGCGFYTGTEKAEQPTVIGALHFTVTFCATNGTPAATGASTADGTVTEPGDPCGQTSTGGTPTRGQGLVALRFPAGMTLPETLTSSNGITAVRSPSYTATFGTPPAGMQIQGYITPPQDISAKTGYTATFDVPLPAGTPGQPFAGPVNARVLAGWRQLILPTDTGSADVTCGGATTCVTSSQPDVNFAFPTRDLAVGTPPATSPTAAVTFPLRFAGQAGPTFALSATTTVPAASALPAHGTFTPTTDQTDATETVTVAVPPGTDPGVYDVTLSAKLGDETRSATGRITVAPVTGPTGTTTATPTPTPTPTRTATPTPTPVRTAVPAATPSPAPVAKPRIAPKRFTLTLKRTGARSFKARGRLKLPAGVVRADGCAGIVRLTAGRVRKTTIITGSCTFSHTLKVKKAGAVTVRATFTGNQVLTPKAARRRRFVAS